MPSRPGPPVPEEEPEVTATTRTLPQDEPPPGAVQHVDRPLSAGLEQSGDRYELARMLGEGGMGEVRLCEDRRIGREVALKVMRPQTAARTDALARFLREARVQGQLEHPAVVPVYDLGLNEAGQPFFTMKRIRGLSLHEILLRLKDGDPESLERFTRRRLLAAFNTICLALDYAHSRGVLHRDLKPANLMLGDFGEVHLIDWGLARVSGVAELPGIDTGHPEPLTNTRQGELMGSPGYLSPEQARGEHTTLTGAADIYSLGAILFELLTFEPMAQGELVDRIHATLRGEVERRPSVRCPKAEVPPELEAIIVRATEHDPAGRFLRPRELAEAVERYLDGDRDEVRRAELAGGHLEQARRQLASGEPERAIGEVMRAMALQPGNGEARRLLAEVLTTVPEQMPAAAQEEYRLFEAKGQASTGGAIGMRNLVWLAYFPVFAFLARDGWAIGLMLAAVAATVGSAFYFRRRRAQGRSSGAWLFGLSSLTLALSSLLFGPFIILPAIVATNTMLFMIHGSQKRRWLILVGSLTILVPWLLEKGGVLAPSVRFTGELIEILPRAIHFPPGLAEGLLLLSSVLLATVPTLLFGKLRDDVYRKGERLFLHSWLLRHVQ